MLEPAGDVAHAPPTVARSLALSGSGPDRLLTAGAELALRYGETSPRVECELVSVASSALILPSELLWALEAGRGTVQYSRQPIADIAQLS